MSDTNITGIMSSSGCSVITRDIARIPDTQAFSGRFSGLLKNVWPPIRTVNADKQKFTGSAISRVFTSCEELLLTPDQMSVAARGWSGGGDFLYQSSIRFKHGSDGALV